jgi:hypothetical protein
VHKRRVLLALLFYLLTVNFSGQRNGHHRDSENDDGRSAIMNTSDAEQPTRLQMFMVTMVSASNALSCIASTRVVFWVCVVSEHRIRGELIDTHLHALSCRRHRYRRHRQHYGAHRSSPQAKSSTSGRKQGPGTVTVPIGCGRRES